MITLLTGDALDVLRTLPAGERRIIDRIRSAIGLAVVVTAVLGCAVVQLAADELEGGR